ncbi:MAG: type 4a pilus biogenesis protein PilO [Vicinamibacterales bacterium]
MDISLTKLPWYAQLGAFVLLAGAGVASFYWYYERDFRADLATREGQLKMLQADIDKGRSTAKKLPEFRAQVGDLEGRLESLEAVLPEEKDAADLLRKMQTVAAQSNLVITEFKPSPTVTKELHAEWPIRLELDGTYHNLATFFDRVGKFTRIVNISDVAIKGKSQPEPNSTITASCVATTFVLLEKPAVDPKAAKDAKGAKGAKARPAAKKAA